MGHWPIGGDDGSAASCRAAAAHKWLVHVNNTNPLLDDDGAERAELRARGLEVAHDGLEWRAMSALACATEAFVARLRDEGARRYHDEHPFHAPCTKASSSREQLQRWVLNRYYYQTRIPIKDALILAKSEDPRFRRAVDASHRRSRRQRRRRRRPRAVAAARPSRRRRRRAR